jgi:hypothetical protein
MYRKTKRNLAATAAREGLRVWSAEAGDFAVEDLKVLARRIAAVAAANAMQLYSCCGERWLDPAAPILPAQCVDWPLLRETIPGAERTDVPRHPSRKGCGCYKSIDIGRYHTCAHGCAYCYAVDDPEQARAALAAHDPGAPGL